MLQTVKDISGYDVGEDPVVYWHAWVGHWLHVPPAAMGGMLVRQYVEAYEWVKEQASA